MAVPSSGTSNLSLFKIAKELEFPSGTNSGYDNTMPFSTYRDAVNGATPISLKNMSTGAGGFDSINTANASADRPNGSVPHNMSEFYSYDHDKPQVLLSTSITTGVDNIYSSYFYGYSSYSFPNMGSASSNTFVNSWAPITAAYWQNSNYLRINFYNTPPTWSDVVINGTSFGASSGWSTSSNQKYKYTTTNPFGTSSGATRTIVFSG